MRARSALALAAVGLGLLTAGLQALVRLPPAGPPPERCGECHAGVTGIEAPHATLGCAGCHLGDAGAGELPEAHAGLVSLPGNLSDAPRTCGRAGCHLEVPARLEKNIMATLNGVVSVDRWVFGEQPGPTAVTPVTALGTSPADLHLRNLCASCHLGREKRAPGPITERTRGGGCLACHLAQAGDLDGGPRHATLRALPHELACLGCHARSGRVSLSYEGWHDLGGGEGACEGAARRRLADGRCVERRPADLHADAGLRCVDCHGSWEVMGDGRRALHREEQSVARCDDCHAAAPTTVGPEGLDLESARLVAARGLADGGRRWLTHRKSGRPLVNAWAAGADGGAWVKGKYSGRVSRAAPPGPDCRRVAHAAVACASCHAAWAPQCVQCHTGFDAGGFMYDLLDDVEREGEWVEQGGPALAEAPTLGVREGDAGREIIPFTPGMILTLEADLHRLFAPASPHTTARVGRSCASCHREPLALGYGRGELSGDGGAWRFTPAWPALADGLPADAWLGFLAAPRPGTSTREDTRPFSVAEQRRVLTVGACLGCHPPESAPMRAALDDFPRVFERRSRRCVLPRWPRSPPG